jgi:hypothetical protein
VSGPIGVVGAYGAVGRAVTRQLHDWGAGPLRIGGRREQPAFELAAEVLGGAGETVAVDARDPASLAAFCDGCGVVVNCAGPSYQLLDVVARAALAAGADYVDPGGDLPVHERLAGADLAGRGRSAVLTAGLMPGLTGLLPEWLARTAFDEVRSLTAYVGLVDRLTPAGAGDYLLSLGGGHGVAQAAWRRGARVARALDPVPDAALPFFPGRVSAYPFLSTEAERLATSLTLEELSWYNVFDGGGRLLGALGRLTSAMVGEADLDAAGKELVQAAELDLFGREPYQLLLFQLDGVAGGEPRTRTLLLRGTDTYELTGFVAAVAAVAIRDGQVLPGLYYATEALDAADVVARLRRVPAVAAFEVLDGPIAGDDDEEGAL